MGIEDYQYNALLFPPACVLTRHHVQGKRQQLYPSDLYRKAPKYLHAPGYRNRGKAPCRHLQEECLQLENDSLRTENAQIRDRNQQLSSQVQETSRQNQQLNERMTLAERLNVTGLSLTPLNKKGKQEKNVAKAKQLRVVFTIPQNNSTPVGAKTIYLRITSPSGQLLGNAGSFSFEGASVPYSAKTVIEYSGEEIAGITIYWDVNTALTAGQYTVELFADNFRLTSRSFELK